MQQLGVAAPLACRSVADVLELDITEKAVISAGEQLVESWWQGAGATHANPRTAASEHVCCSTYRQWVQGGAPAAPPHMHLLVPHKMLRTLMRLRAESLPLRIATGRYEGVNHVGVARSARVCRVPACAAAGCVEDVHHFLLECPAYAQVRARWRDVFDPYQTPAALLQQSNQARLAAAVAAMVQARAVRLGEA
mgnify:FL=1